MFLDYIPEETHNDMFIGNVHNTVTAGRNLYYGVKLSRVEIDSILLPVLAELKNKQIWYLYRFVLRTGLLTRIKGNVLYIREDGKKRRINIKNLQVYHEATNALLSLYK
jgi:hypothetical protein